MSKQVIGKSVPIKGANKNKQGGYIIKDKGKANQYVQLLHVQLVIFLGIKCLLIHSCFPETLHIIYGPTCFLLGTTRGHKTADVFSISVWLLKQKIKIKHHFWLRYKQILSMASEEAYV